MQIYGSHLIFTAEAFFPLQAAGVGYFLWLEVMVHHVGTQGSLLSGGVS